jgi:hypothetical protein
MTPYLPSAEAIDVAREHVLWHQIHVRGVGPGQLLTLSLIPWPHEREPSWTDVVLVLAAWVDRGRRGQVYRHDCRIIPLPELRIVAHG